MKGESASSIAKGRAELEGRLPGPFQINSSQTVMGTSGIKGVRAGEQGPAQNLDSSVKVYFIFSYNSAILER